MGPTAEQKEWLSLHEASARLGISPATLRLWADRGRVHAFRTPGGHRRFRESDVAALAARQEPETQGAPSRVLAHAALGRTRFEVSDGWLAGQAWYERFPAGAREKHRDLGRRLVMTLSDVISSADAEKLLDERARELGQDYARVNAEYRVPLADALRAFLFFRDSFIESLVELSRASPSLDALPLMRRTSRFVDRMLLAMVEASEGQEQVDMGGGVEK